MRRSEQPNFSTSLMLKLNEMSESAKASYDERRKAWGVKVAEKSALESELLDVERQYRTISVLPAKHPAREQEAGIVERIAALKAEIAAVVIPPPPWGRYV